MAKDLLMIKIVAYRLNNNRGQGLLTSPKFLWRTGLASASPHRFDPHHARVDEEATPPAEPSLCGPENPNGNPYPR